MNNWLVLPNINYGRDLDAYITGAPNFQYGELVQSAKAVELNIANVPTEEQWKRLETYAIFILQPLRNKVGRLHISSGFRCPELNRVVGSSSSSFHPQAGACDLEAAECSLMDLLEEAYKLHFSELIAENFPSGWVHVGFIKGDDRRMLKLKDSTHNYTPVTIDELRTLYPTKG